MTKLPDPGPLAGKFRFVNGTTHNYAVSAVFGPGQPPIPIATEPVQPGGTAEVDLTNEIGAGQEVRLYVQDGGAGPWWRSIWKSPAQVEGATFIFTEANGWHTEVATVASNTVSTPGKFEPNHPPGT